MKLLVGLPVFRVLDLVRKSIDSVLGVPADVLVIDNNADQDIKLLLKRNYEGKVYVKHNDTNLYCNGAWNQILQYGLSSGYDIIALGSSDAALHPGWYEALQHLSARRNEVWVPRVGEPPNHRVSRIVTGEPNYNDVEVVTDGLAGYFTFFPRAAAELVYPIPANLRHWFGDQYMYEKLRRNGWSTVIANNMKAHHQQSAITFRVPEAQEVIRQDALAWEKL